MGNLHIENQLDEKTKELILKMEEDIEAKDNEIKSKDKEIENLKNELAYLKHQILNKNRKIFGSSSEQARELRPIYRLMKEELLKRSYIQADETVLKVLVDKGKESNKQKYMWLYKSPDKDQLIIIYDYKKTRSGSCPKNFLNGFSGYLQTDGYAGYNKVENIKRLYCLAHIRRKFHEIIVNLDKEALKTSRALIGFNYCAKLYEIEKELNEQHNKKENYYEERYKTRLEKSKPLIEEFIAYVDKEILDAVPQSALGKALAYAKPLLPSLNVFLEDGALEIDNNSAEGSIKPFVIGRKNWLFSASTKGAESSALIYSIIETAKNNNLVVEKYLLYLMDNFVNIDPTDKDGLLKILPFSKDLPDDLKIKAK